MEGFQIKFKINHLHTFHDKEQDMEPLGRMMTNLETLCFGQDSDFIHAGFYWFKAKYAFKHFIPFFRGISNCLGLQELHLDCYGWNIGDFRGFVAYFPRIKRLKIYSGKYVDFKDNEEMYRTALIIFPWILRLENLEELEFKSIHLKYDYSDESEDEITTDFPILEEMTKLRKLELNACTFVQEVEVFVKLHDILPALKTLVIRPYQFKYHQQHMDSECSGNL